MENNGFHELWIKQNAEFIAYVSDYGKLIFYKGCPDFGIRIELYDDPKSMIILSNYLHKFNLMVVRIIDGKTCIDIAFQ